MILKEVGGILVRPKGMTSHQPVKETKLHLKICIPESRYLSFPYALGDSLK